jgi:hypothetical protein
LRKRWVCSGGSRCVFVERAGAEQSGRKPAAAGAHVQPYLGDDRLGGLAAGPGDLVQPVDGGQHRGTLNQVGVRAGGAVRVDALRGRHDGDQLLDPGRDRADLRGQPVDVFALAPDPDHADM